MAKSFIFIFIILLIAACSSSAPLLVSEDDGSVIEESQTPPSSEIIVNPQSSTLPSGLEATPLEVDNKTVYIIAPQAPQETAVLSNGHLFLYDNQSKVWRTELKKENILSNMSFRYNPKQVKDIPTQGSLNKTFDLKTVYITFDPSKKEYMNHLALVAHELSMHLSASFDRTPEPACTLNETDCPQVKTCADKNAVIFLDNKPEPSITFAGNCLILHGQGEDLIKTAEKMIFIWYGFYK